MQTHQTVGPAGYFKYTTCSENSSSCRSNWSCDKGSGFRAKSYRVQTAPPIFSLRTQIFPINISHLLSAMHVRSIHCLFQSIFNQLQIAYSMSVCGVDVSGGCRLQSISGNTSISPPNLKTEDFGQQIVQGITGDSCSYIL